MAVHIEKIKVTNLGPLPEFDMRFGPVNLIYGRNEQGKTHLVEFLIRALFKKPGFDNLRETGSRGEVFVSGLGETLVPFTLKARSRKLEDYIAINARKLPPSMSRLIVVRAGEVSLAQNAPGGIDRVILKEYLSNEGFLDEIQNRIKKTIQGASLDSAGMIIGNMSGEIKTREEKKKQLTAIDNLISRLQAIYSGGHRAILNHQLETERSTFDNLERARRHLAWQLSQEIDHFEDEKASLPQDVIQTLGQNIHQYRELKKQCIEREHQRKEKEILCTHYPWLVEAIEIYKNAVAQNVQRPSIYIVIMIGGLLLAAVAASFLKLPIVTLLLNLLAAGLGWEYYRRMNILLAKAAEVKEKEAIAAEFLQRFKIPLSGLAVLEEQRKKLEPETIAVRFIQDELEKVFPVIETQQEAIQQAFKSLMGMAVEETDWDAQFSGLQDRRTKVEEVILETQRHLAQLNASSVDFLPEDPGIVFDSDAHETCRARITGLESELRAETDAMNDLKREIANYTGDAFSVEWETLIQNMRVKRADMAEQYRALTAQIVAGVLVNEALATLRQQENQHIRDGLQAAWVSEPIKRVTHKYEQIDLEGDQLRVTDGSGGFLLSELSTGAQEQVLLSLRMAFSKKIMGQEPLFLILDDAFQHSDWQRREWLMDEMIGLVQNGWQILYFTMDDHVRDLFETRVRPVFGADYCYRDLGQSQAGR